MYIIAYLPEFKIRQDSAMRLQDIRLIVKIELSSNPGSGSGLALQRGGSFQASKDRQFSGTFHLDIAKLVSPCLNPIPIQNGNPDLLNCDVDLPIASSKSVLAGKSKDVSLLSCSQMLCPVRPKSQTPQG